MLVCAELVSKYVSSVVGIMHYGKVAFKVI
jgi:hypothetical protein